jgi:hypothetical protein
MDFQSVINSIMKDVNDGSNEPFIIYRDNERIWQRDYTQNQYGETYNWVESVKESDPFATTFTGKYFTKDNAASVYDEVLSGRVFAEFYHNRDSGLYDGSFIEGFLEDVDENEAYALACFFKENIGSFSLKTKNYLAALDRPFTALVEMCPFDLETEDKDCFYNVSLAKDAIESIENAVSNNLSVYAGIIAPEKRNINGYEEKLCLQLAGQYVVLAENPIVPESYLVCNIKSDNPLGLEEPFNGAVTGDYVEAMREFTNRLDELVETLEYERRDSGLPVQKLTASDCLPKGDNENWQGKLIVVKPEVLSPEYRSAQHQLAICTGGFGSKPNARGNAVYVKELYSEKEMRYERYQIAGIADPSKIPEWAKVKMIAHKVKESPNGVLEDGTFKYGGYHFTPYRKFDKRDGNFYESSLHLKSDHELGLSTHDWKREDYDIDSFYAASSDKNCDIFKCVENGKLYVPCTYELFEYKEPPKKEIDISKPFKPKKKKPSLLVRLDEAKTEAAAINAGQKETTKTKKHAKEVE